MTDFKSLLKSIGRNPSSSELVSALEFLSNHEDKQIQVKAQAIVNGISRATVENQRLRKQVNLYQTLVDLAAFGIARTSVMRVSNNTQALILVNDFSADWFKRLPLSPYGKIQVAASLITRYKELGVKYPAFWDKIVNSDAETLNSIEFDLDMLIT